MVAKFLSPKFGRVALLVVLCFFAFTLPALAQSAPLVALVNSGGQLIVSSGDGSFRWIVTNPGETLVGDFVWSNQRLPYTQSGQWGYLRVLPAGDTRIQPLGIVGMGAKRAEIQSEPQGVPTAMR